MLTRITKFIYQSIALTKYKRQKEVQHMTLDKNYYLSDAEGKHLVVIRFEEAHYDKHEFVTVKYEHNDERFKVKTNYWTFDIMDIQKAYELTQMLIESFVALMPVAKVQEQQLIHTDVTKEYIK